MERDKEEGEMSDDDVDMVDVVSDSAVNEVQEAKSTMLFKADKNGVGIELLERVDAAKLEERAKRFGLDLTGNRIVTQKQIDELYDNCGVESSNERHFRFDALHLSGIDGLTTRDIFEYLSDYKPVSLEWIDDISCNVVCHDHISAALALLVHSREITNQDIKTMLKDKSSHHWREGMPHPKKDSILMTFATNSDKKIGKRNPEQKKFDKYYAKSMDLVSKNPWGDLCQSWGVYDHQEVFQRKLPKSDEEEEQVIQNETIKIKNKQLAKRLGKRNYRTDDSDEDNSDDEWKKKSKTPRMRMHADDEESKLKKKMVFTDKYDESDDEEEDVEYFPPLSIEVINSDSVYKPREQVILSEKFRYHVKDNLSQKETVQSRLGTKISDSWSSDECSSDNSDHNILSKVQKVNNHKSSSVWSRLEGKQSNTATQSDLRQMLKSKTQKKPSDLRERLRKSKQSNLRIEIDNNYVNE